MFEDSRAGVAAGCAAGVAAVIGVGNRALDTDSDFVVPDLTQITWSRGLLRIHTRHLLRSRT